MGFYLGIIVFMGKYLLSDFHFEITELKESDQENTAFSNIFVLSFYK